MKVLFIPGNGKTHIKNNTSKIIFNSLPYELYIDCHIRIHTVYSPSDDYIKVCQLLWLRKGRNHNWHAMKDNTKQIAHTASVQWICFSPIHSKSVSLSYISIEMEVMPTTLSIVLSITLRIPFFPLYRWLFQQLVDLRVLILNWLRWNKAFFTQFR